MRIAIALALLALAPSAHAEEAARADTCLTAFASRYAAEAERNLDRTFSPAAHSDVVLSYDEADALFGRGEDAAHDRYANQDASYLLARIEAFGGLHMLASNFRRAGAAGFDRRARYAGIVLIETETGVRVIEFARADRRHALAYAEASLRACPVTEARTK